MDRGGCLDAIVAEALHAYDKVIGLIFDDTAVDGSLHKSPCGTEGTGKNPTDRYRLGCKCSILTDANAVPVGVAIDGAKPNDSVMLALSLDDAKRKGLLQEIETLWLSAPRTRMPRASA